MLKRLLGMVLPLLASSCGNSAKPGATQEIDPKKILFSLPTLCDPAPALDDSVVTDKARSLHEDDWRQIEFVPAANAAHIRSELAALAIFKQEHRQGSGWDQVYLRKEHPSPFSTLSAQFVDLPTLTEYPLALSGQKVRGGFALADSDGWFIYGQKTPEGKILELAVQPTGSQPTQQFARALVQIAHASGTLLVDWYHTSIVDTSSPDLVLAWAHRDPGR